MGFWGMSKEGKQARSSLANLAADQTAQATAWQNRAAGGWDTADLARNQAWGHWGQRLNEGFASPATQRGYGQEILNIEDPLNRMWARQGSIQSNWENTVPKAADVYGQMAADIEGKRANLGDYSTGQQYTIDEGYGSMGGRVTDASGRIMGNLGDTYGTAGNAWNTAYGDLAGNVNAARDKMLAETGGTYGQMGGNVEDYAAQVEKLRPGSEFQVARTARSFAPAVAAAAGRLRRGGIDPNGVQASGVLGAVEANRARAMDDAAAAGIGQYVGARGQLAGMRNDILGGRLNTDIGLTQGALGMTTNLGQTQAEANRQMALAQGAEARGQMRADTAALNELEARRQGQTLAHQQDVYGQSQGLMDERTKAALANRGMALEDFGTYGGIMGGQNALEMTGLGLSQQQYELGRQQVAADQAARDQAAGQIGQIAQQGYGNALGAGGLGLNYGRAAQGGLQDIYAREAANAGWGTKMLLGAGLSAAAGGLGALAGGGNFWKGAAGGLSGGGGYGYGQPYYG